MPTTYEPIQTYTLASPASSINFTSIPATYTDIRLVFVGTASVVRASVRYNSDSATNYSRTFIYGDGTSAASGRDASVNTLNTLTNLNNTIPSMFTLDVFSYAGSTYKTALETGSFDYNGSGLVDRLVGLWRSTSAITSITIYNSINANNFNTGCTATLYGIKNA
jgi:hypothetical protein